MKVLSKIKVKFDENKKKNVVFVNYYLQLDNGVLVPIKTSFKEDLPVLRSIAIRINDDETK